MTEVRAFHQGGNNPDLSSADLMRECGRRVTDVELWQTFEERFHRHITNYVLRTLRVVHGRADTDVACDLVQEVFVLEGGVGAGAVAPEQDRQFSLRAKRREVARAKDRHARQGRVFCDDGRMRPGATLLHDDHLARALAGRLVGAQPGRFWLSLGFRVLGIRREAGANRQNQQEENSWSDHARVF